MNFQAALTAMQNGQRVRRAEWTKVVCAWIDQNEIVANAVNPTGAFPYLRLPLALRTVDLLAEDWELVA